MGNCLNCCGSGEDDSGPDLEERRRLQVEAAERRQKEEVKYSVVCQAVLHNQN